jgi:hypothetical protein
VDKPVEKRLFGKAVKQGSSAELVYRRSNLFSGVQKPRPSRRKREKEVKICERGHAASLYFEKSS